MKVISISRAVGQIILLILSVQSIPGVHCQQVIRTINETGPRHVVVYAARSIRTGAIINDKELKETVINTRGFKQNEILSRRSILGRKAKYAIEQGQIIKEQDLVALKNRTVRRPKTSCEFTVVKYVQSTKRIPARAVISSKDLIEGLISTCDSTRWMATIDSVVGCRAKTSIDSGQLITVDVLEANINETEQNAHFGKSVKLK
jgi:flagella basal body P-ring formation protein FlgA